MPAYPDDRINASAGFLLDVSGLLHEASQRQRRHVLHIGVGEAPVVAKGAMAALAGKPPTPEAIARAQAALDTDLNPPADLHGGPDMKRHLARVLLGRALGRLSGTQEARAA